MKEATGELSTTVIAIVAIAAILAIFTVFLLPTLRAQIALSQACSNGPGYVVSNEDGSTVSCENAARGAQYQCQVTINGRTSQKTCRRKKKKKRSDYT